MKLCTRSPKISTNSLGHVFGCRRNNLSTKKNSKFQNLRKKSMTFFKYKNLLPCGNFTYIFFHKNFTFHGLHMDLIFFENLKKLENSNFLIYAKFLTSSYFYLANILYFSIVLFHTFFKTLQS